MMRFPKNPARTTSIARQAQFAPALPSGQTVEPLDLYIEEQTDGQRFLVLRYLAPRIARDGGDLGYEDVLGDLDRLCETEGLVAAKAAGTVDQVVVVLLDRAVARGVPDPKATMYISAYIPDAGGCLWQ